MADKSIFRLLSIALLLQICLGNPVEEFNLADEYITQTKSDSGFRLPMNFMPDSYLIRLSDINFVDATFKGQTEITFEALTTTSELKLNVDDLREILNQQSTRITKHNTSETLVITSMEIAAQYQIMTITVETEFQQGEKYIITFMEYTGSMGHDMEGFYRSSYVENGETVWMGTTQMQATDARKVFPCFDEPVYKATFTVSIQRPIVDQVEYGQSFSNMVGQSQRDSERRMWDHFAPTPKMSTYLLAFIVSKYAILDAIEEDNKIFRILARPEAEGQSKYALDEGVKLTDVMSEYMKLDYYTMGNIKMDQAAIPDFWAGAMENWGLVTYREAYLLANDDESNARYKQFIVTILAHEIAHMWFGNYITTHWWSDTWLNEGFATLFEFKMPELANSDYRLDLQFPVVVVQRALLADTPTRSAPLTNPNVNSPSEIMGHFSVISYSKGGSVLRMMEHWLGPENFRDSLNYYMTQNRYGVVTPNNLYDALQEHAPEGHNVTEMMSKWVVASGYPLITATINYDTKTMTLTQKRFTKAWEEDVDYLFDVPITYATKSRPDFDNTTPDHLLKGAREEVTGISIDGHEWIVLNKKQTGYYRVNYDTHTWEMLERDLKTTERTSIHEINRAQIVDDLFNLAREDVIAYNRAFSVLDYLRDDEDYAPWTSAYAGFSFIRQQFSINSTLLGNLDSHIKILMKKVTEKMINYTEDNSLMQLFRLNTMNFACLVGVEDCLTDAEGHFKSFIESDTPVPPNRREYVYCNGLRNGQPEHFDKMWETYLASNVANDKVVVLGALGCTKNDTKLSQLLNEVADLTTSQIRNHDQMAPIISILNGNPENTEVVLKYLENDFLKLRNRLGSYSSLFTNLGSRLTGHQINRFYQLIIDNMSSLTNSEITAGMTAYSNLALQSAYVRHAGVEIDAWLTERYKNAGALATSSLAIICVSLFLHLYNKVF